MRISLPDAFSTKRSRAACATWGLACSPVPWPNVFLVTNLARWITDGRGSYLYFDLSGIVLGVVGAALLLIAHVVDAARAAQDELDGIL